MFIDVLKTITEQFHINMRAMNVVADDGIFKGNLEVYVYDKKELQDLFVSLRKIPEIKAVKRVKTVNS